MLLQKMAVEAHSYRLLMPALKEFAFQNIKFETSSWILYSCLFLIFLSVFLWRRGQKVYLLDFECFRPSDELKVTYKRFIEGSRECGAFSSDAMDFQERIINKSGLSNETFFPPGLHMEPPKADMALAREEAEIVMFNAVRNLLERTGLQPKQIDIIVVNCSLFNPTPSLAAMIINHFKMRNDIESYNLGGMGCSAGIISIGLARKLLGSLGRGGYALVVSTENITQNWYRGNERSMLIPNTIFRMGSAAVMLTNKRNERRRSLYELSNLVRVHMGADDVAYKCVFQHADEDGTVGVELNRDLVRVAGKAMEMNLRRLGPLVLPLGEKIAFVTNLAARKLFGLQVSPYVPDFRKAFDHFCLHAGGRGVIEGLSKQLGLTEPQMAPSANTLYWYGNTSSSTVWYSFSFAESVQGIKRGDFVWQIGFGSGFKCNSVVWKALRNVKRNHEAWKHIVGREDEALACLRQIQEMSTKEKMEKEKVTPVCNGKENMLSPELYAGKDKIVTHRHHGQAEANVRRLRNRNIKV